MEVELIADINNWMANAGRFGAALRCIFATTFRRQGNTQEAINAVGRLFSTSSSSTAAYESVRSASVKRTASAWTLARQAFLARRGMATGIASSISQELPLAGLAAGISPGYRRALAWWLGGCSAWTFSMVVLGGVTRLTRSGLSMTDWKFTGESPPQTAAEWDAEFARYRQSPEFQKVNSTMTVDEFKFIYWMEWAHRWWGRGLGIAFVLPAAWFAAKGVVTRPLAKRLGLLLLMGGSQGLVGWWMVRSGLQEPKDNAVPRVSPYRLAAHLTSAFAIYATLVWTTLSIAFPAPSTVLAVGSQGARAAGAVGRLALPVAGLVSITAISGAFVAGLDAGHAYNTFPDMNGQWFPDEYWSVPGWRNAFESTAAVQLHHRVLALSTLASILALWRYGTSFSHLPKSSKTLLHLLGLGAMGQVTLGVVTLLQYVPVSLGSAHQAGALTLFTIMLSLLYSLRPLPTLLPIVASSGSASAWATGAAFAATIGIGGAVAVSR